MSREESEMSQEEYPRVFPSGRVLQSACALIPSSSDPIPMDQVSVLKCHLWIGNADTHSTRGFITEFNHTLITSIILKNYNNMAEGHLNKITAEASKVSESINSNGIAECMTTT